MSAPAASFPAARPSPPAQRVDKAALIGFGVIAASIAIDRAPFAVPMPGLLQFAESLAATGRTPTPFFHVGYVAFMALALELGGLHAIFASQALLYIASVVLAYSLASAAGAGRSAALVAGFAVALHPYELLNIKRIVDSNLAVPLLLAIAYLTVRVWRRSPGAADAIIAGVALGLGIVTRANYLALWPLIVGVFVAERRFQDAALAGTLALIVPLLITLWATGHARITPREGEYTLFLGANPYTARALLDDYNVEGTASEAFAADALVMNDSDYYRFCDAHAPEFERLALAYMMQHPVSYLGLGMLKLLTLFRPDYRRLADSNTASPIALIIVQTALALIAPLWLATRIYLRATVRFFGGLWTAPIVCLLLIPMFLVSADPRYRLPLETLMLCDLSACWLGIRAAADPTR
ncbi:MAG TPA: hypothetical protein VEJ86_01735 [Candidatus Binataceae bacterium]|nr:hypothetical protein [Candidatus Binataceae bacterium]